MSAPVFSTLGCRLNAYETEAMKELAGSVGLDNAVVVNTCAVMFSPAVASMMVNSMPRSASAAFS